MAYEFAGIYGPEIYLTGDAGVQLLSGRFVHIYDTGTSNLATLYTDRDKLVEADNPVTIDSRGNLYFYAEPGLYDARLITDGSDGPPTLCRVDADLEDQKPIMPMTFWSPAGNLTVSTGTYEYRVAFNSTMLPVVAHLKGAHTGAPIIFDIKNNGVTMFAAPPEIAVGVDTVEVTVLDSDLAEGDRITADVLQVGSSAPGHSLVIETGYR